MIDEMTTGSDPFDALKNERDYIVQSRAVSQTGNALEWAVNEISRLRATNAELRAALDKIINYEKRYLTGEAYEMYLIARAAIEKAKL